MTSINEQLIRMRQHGAFNRFTKGGTLNRYIEYIRFPKFKNLEPGLKIDFSFPVTAITGQNGSNKSSILRAIQACPEGYSISDYWFETEIDKIDIDQNGNRDPQRYIYGYKLPSGRTAEAVKTRVARSRDGDNEYWEPGKIRSGDGMPPLGEVNVRDRNFSLSTRWKLVDKNVVYLDFRGELPAFDILMNFNHRKDELGSNLRQKKKIARRYSKNLLEAIQETEADTTLWNKERVYTPVTSLGDSEIGVISNILGRQYESIKLIEHDYYGFIGWTALLKSSSGMKYSEAFSGSGEFAAVMLVYKVSRAPEGSLILLDEPETSLHPAAQINLINFVKEQAKSGKHQFVISTHSPNIIESLPPCAIKSLDINPETNKVILRSQQSSKSEAFSRLGSPVQKQTIFVEDDLAKYIVENAIYNKISKEAYENIEVRSAQSGADTIRKNFLPGWSLASINNEIHVLFDGDQRKYNILDNNFNNSNESESSRTSKMESLGISLRTEGGNDTSTDRIDSKNSSFLEWYSKNVKFLPGITNPEYQLMQFVEGNSASLSNYHSCTRECPDIQSSDTSCIFSTYSDSHSWESVASDCNNRGKEFWKERTTPDFGQEATGEDIFNCQKNEIRKLITSKNPEFNDYLTMISEEVRVWLN